MIIYTIYDAALRKHILLMTFQCDRDCITAIRKSANSGTAWLRDNADDLSVYRHATFNDESGELQTEMMTLVTRVAPLLVQE